MARKRDVLIRDHIDISPTAENKGLILTMRVTVYDNGILKFGDIPMNGSLKAKRTVHAVNAVSTCDHASRAIRALLEECEWRWNPAWRA